MADGRTDRLMDGLMNIWIDDGWSVRYYILDERFSRYSPVSECVCVCVSMYKKYKMFKKNKQNVYFKWGKM